MLGHCAMALLILFRAVVVSEESQYLVGLVARKDLASAILNADRNIVDTNPDDALVYFTDGIPNIEDETRGRFMCWINGEIDK